MNNKELLLFFKDKFQIKTTEELGFILGQAATNVSAWQHNKKPMPMNIKFRLLEHINFSTETGRFAEVFVGKEEHQVLMQQDLDRIEDVQKRRLGMQGNFIDKKWIERISELQNLHKLNDEQTAKYMGLTNEKLLNIRSGNEELTMTTKGFLVLALGVSNKITTSEKLQSTLDKRLKK
jgi:hypothetical protein